jgi:murein DD-endopeptidase MepM/ murein hydrolase activator NlpD
MVLALTGVAAGYALLAAQSLTLTPAHDARALQPGEIVRLRIESSGPVRSVEGTAFGRPVHFVGGSGAASWDGLIAIDVETEPGKYPAMVTALPVAGGSAVKLSYPLVVQPKEFDTRSLKVDPQFVNPPDDVLPRIKAETALLAKVFAVLTLERLWTGPFIKPVDGPSTGRYGELSVFNGEPRSRHRGTDFRASTGTPVRAPARGRVALSEDLYFSGGSVIIDHGHGLFSQLAHLSRRDVEEGAMVEAGQVVGLAGATGRVTGPHLHWSARLGTASIDPVSLLEVLGPDAPTSSH